AGGGEHQSDDTHIRARLFITKLGNFYMNGKRSSEEEAGLPMASNDNSRSGQIGDNLQPWLAAYRQHALSVLQRGQILCRI
ncbi:hypothetical protein ACQVP2_32990, partial [Methylobacterium aquaticum]|uniref:hypothetical protein n=1 Tax=Methylobacterium aquaticum TaxID=270351 RepID=UPI003D187090